MLLPRFFLPEHTGIRIHGFIGHQSEALSGRRLVEPVAQLSLHASQPMSSNTTSSSSAAGRPGRPPPRSSRKHGLTVGLFEREKFPRFHIGESLIPETYWVLKRLNMLPKMQASHFVKKHSVQFVNANGKLSAPFYFWDNKPHECSQTWQVVRSEFDQMMLDNAREHGVEAHDGVHVLDVLFDGDRGRAA